MKPIKVYGEQAKEITSGQVFIAQIGSVEGRTVVTLVPDNEYWARQDNPEAYEERGEMEEQEILDRQEDFDDSFIDMDGDEALARGFDEDEMRSEAMAEME